MNFFLLSLTLVVGVAFPVAAAEKLSVSADRENALYKTGETIKFNVSLTNDGKAVAGKTLPCHGNARGLPSRIITDQDGKTIVEVKAEQPGFFRYCVSPEMPYNGKKSVSAVIGVDPLTILPARPEPADFDDFWNQQKELLKTLPMKPEIKEIKVSNPRIAAFEVTINMPDEKSPARGYLTFPKNANPQSLPLRLEVHAAGIYGISPVVHYAASGWMCFTLLPHSMLLGQPQEYYAAQKKILNGYWFFGAESREKLYFFEMYRRLYRSILFLKSRPEWNGQVFAVTGTSQGGGQALVAAGLDPAITCVVACVPAMCDLGGVVAKRWGGWPHFQWSEEYKKNSMTVLKAIDYIDAAFFARRINPDAACFLSVGFLDTTVPPSSVYSAFNVIPAKNKIIVDAPSGTHTVSREIYRSGEQWIETHLKSKCRKIR